MENSPLRFLDLDASLMLSDQVRLSQEEEARRFHTIGHMVHARMDLNFSNHYLISHIFNEISTRTYLPLYIRDAGRYEVDPWPSFVYWGSMNDPPHIDRRDPFDRQMWKSQQYYFRVDRCCRYYEGLLSNYLENTEHREPEIQ